MFLAAGAIGLTVHDRSLKAAAPASRQQVVPVVFTAIRTTASQRSPAPTASNRATTATPEPDRRLTVTEVTRPGTDVNPISTSDILSPLPARSITSPAAVLQAAPQASRYEPSADAPDTPQPNYPSLALRRGYEGRVVIEFTVAASGQITEVQLGRSSGFAVLDEAALETVSGRWQFPPGLVRHHFVEIVFQLE